MKIFLKIIAAVAALLFIIIIGINLYFTNERLQNMLMPYINESVGRTVEVETMSATFFSTFPKPGVEVTNLSIPGDTEEDTLLSMDQLIVGVELFPLLRNEINITELELDNPRFVYKIYADSTTNIDFLLETEKADTASANGYNVNIPYFEVHDGYFGYRDLTSNTSATLNDVEGDLSLSYADSIHSSIAMKVGGFSAMVDSVSYISGLPLSLTEKSTIHTESEFIQLNEGTFAIRGLEMDLTGTLSNWSKAFTVDLSFNSSTDNFGDLLKLVPEAYAGSLEGFESGGTLDLGGTVQGQATSDSIPHFDVRIDVQDGYLKDPDLPQAIEDIQIVAHATNELVTINSLNLQAAQNTLSADGQIQNLLDESNRYINMDMNLKFDLATIKEFYPIDEDTLRLEGMLTAQATLDGPADQIERAVQSGNINLDNGFIDHKELDIPFRNITLESVLEGPRMTIIDGRFQSGDNSVEATGIINNYLGEDRTLNLEVQGGIRLQEISNYYELEPGVTDLTGDADFNLTIKGPANNPAEMAFSGKLTVSDAAMSGESLREPVKDLNGIFTLAPQKATLSELTFNMGSSDMNIQGGLSNYMEYLKNENERTATPQLTGQFRSNYLNLDELIDWESDTSSTFNLELPNLNGNFSAQIDRLKITGVTMRNLQAEATSTPARINLTQANVELFEGEANGTMEWEIPGDRPSTFNFEGTLDSLRLESFFGEYPILGRNSQFHKFISGTFSTKIDYTTKIDTELNPLIPTTVLNGTFGMSKAQVQNHPLQQKIGGFTNIKALRDVALDQWKSTISVKDNIFTISDLALTSSDIGMELNGTQHLQTDKIDFHISLILPGRFKETIAPVISSQAANALTRDNGNIMIPLQVTGTYGDPSVQPDQSVIEPIVKDYLKDKAGNVIKDLFGRDKEEEAQPDTAAADTSSQN